MKILNLKMNSNTKDIFLLYLKKYKLKNVEKHEILIYQF